LDDLALPDSLRLGVGVLLVFAAALLATRQASVGAWLSAHDDSRPFTWRTRSGRYLYVLMMASISFVVGVVDILSLAAEF